MPRVLTSRPVDEGFIVSEAPGYQSRNEITIAADQDLDAGTVLVAGPDGYVPITEDDIVADDTKAVILCRRKNSERGPTRAAAIVKDAEVKDSELVLGDGLMVADVAPILARVGTEIIVRRAV